MPKRLHGIFKRLNPGIPQIKNIMLRQQLNAQRNRPVGIIIVPCQFNGRRADPPQTFDRFCPFPQHRLIFFNHRSMMVNPGKINLIAQLKHIFHRQGKIAHHHHIMLFNFVIRDFHIMIQPQQFNLRIDAFNNRPRPFAVMVGNMINTQHIILPHPKLYSYYQTPASHFAASTGQFPDNRIPPPCD